MKWSNLLLSTVICFGIGAYAADAEDKDKEAQAREKLESARKQLNEAQRDYRDALRGLREHQIPEARVFGTQELPHRFEWRGSFGDNFHLWPQVNELMIPHGDKGLYIFGDVHWGSHSRSHMELVSLNPGLGRYFGTDEGVLVLNVSEENAYQLQSGDVILSINGRESRDPGRVHRLLRTYEPEETVTLSIMRDKKKRTLEATMPGYTALTESNL